MYEFVGEHLLMVSISLGVGERDALFTTMNGCLRKRVAKTLTHKYAVLSDGYPFPQSCCQYCGQHLSNGLLCSVHGLYIE